MRLPWGSTSVTQREKPWLIKVQNSSGSWGKGENWAPTEGHPAHTGMVIYLFLEKGGTLGSELYGESVMAGMKWLIAYAKQKDLSRKLQQKDGAIAHAMASLGLSFSFTMTKIPKMQTAMDKCTKLIIDNQQATGAFGKRYDKKEWDLGTTAWNLLALREAQRAGCMNPKLQQALKRGKEFLMTQAYAGNGLFKTSSKFAEPSIHSGAAIKFLADSGEHENKIVWEYIDKQIIARKLPIYREIQMNPERLREWKKAYLHDCYFDHWLMFNLGQQLRGSYWKTWRQAVEKNVVRSQTAEGCWDGILPMLAGSNSASNKVLTTVFAELPIEVYYIYPSPRLWLEQKENSEKKGDMLIEIE